MANGAFMRIKSISVDDGKFVGHLESPVCRRKIIEATLCLVAGIPVTSLTKLWVL